MDTKAIKELGFNITERRDRTFLSLDMLPSPEQIRGLLELMTVNEELFFWNYYHWTSSDPGSYVTAYVENGKAVMKEANHGWSGNYHAISIDDLIELIIRNWDKDWDNQQEFNNAVAIEKTIRSADVLMGKGIKKSAIKQWQIKKHFNSRLLYCFMLCYQISLPLYLPL